MELFTALVFIALVLFGADRLLLWLEARGHVRWRRRRPEEPPAGREVGLHALLEESSR